MKKIIYGIHVIQSIFDNNPKNLINVFLLENTKNKRIKNLEEEIKKKKINIILVKKKWLDKQSKGKFHQGIAAEIKKERKYHESDLENFILLKPNPFFLFLDGITDPHNLGACLRCADAAGVHALVIPKNRSVKINSTVIKVASGAVETVPVVVVTNLTRTLKKLKKLNVNIIGMSSKSNKNIYLSKLTGPIALVIGSEGYGLRRITKTCCNELISIPMYGKIRSLNLSVATGISLFEIIRQRNLKK